METLFCIAVAVVVIIGILVVIGNNSEKQRRELEAARLRYEQALAELKQEPTAAPRRQRALEAGREYATLSRQNKGPTVFDEMALKNDLDAATAGAVTVATAPAQQTPQALSIADRLRQIDDLKTQGLLTETEHQERRSKILEEM